MASIFDPIYAALEDGAYEEAVKLCSKPDLARFTVTQALLSYAYASLRQNSKAMDLARRIIQTKPKEEIVLSTLAYTLRKCRADKELLIMYETAINTPGSTFSEGFVHELFTCYCMEGDLKKMQMLAQKQYKLHPEKVHFLCWSVACMVQLDQRNPAELPPTMLMVAERTLKKVLFDLQKEKQPSADELVLYLCVLARQAKQQALDASSGSPSPPCKETLREALTALEELTGRKRHGKASMLLSDQKHFEQRPDLVSVHRLQRSVMKLDLLVRLGDVLALGAEARAVLQDYPDQWNVHKLLIECVICVGFAATSGTILLGMPEETVSTQRVDEQNSGSSSSTENPIFQSFPSQGLSLGYKIEQLLSSTHSTSSYVLNSKALDSSVVEHRAFLAGLQASAIASSSAKGAAAVGSEGSKNSHSNSNTASARIRGPFLAELELLLTYRRLLQVSGADMRLPLGWVPSADIPPLHPTLATNPESLPPPPPPTDNGGQGAELITEIVALIAHYCELFSSKQSCFSDVKRYVYVLRSSPSALAGLRRWALSERDRHLDPLMGASITALAPSAFASTAGDAVSADADGQQGLSASVVGLKICEQRTYKGQEREEGEDKEAAGDTGAAVVSSLSSGADAGATGGVSGGGVEGGGGGAKKNKKKKKKKSGSTGGGAGASARAVAATTSPADDDSSGGKPNSALPTGETLRGEIAGSSAGQRADENAKLLLRLCQYCKLDQLAAYCSQLIARYGRAVDGCPDRETANESVADIAAATTAGLGTGRGDDCVSTSASFRAALYSATKFLTDGCIGGDREYQPGDELLLQSSYESFHRFANLAKRSENINITSTTMTTMGEKAAVGDRQQEAIAVTLDRQQQQQQLVCCMEWAQSLVYGSSKSPYCYGFRIELLHAYRHLAIGDGSVAAFQGLGAKHTQMDSMSYLILPVLLETGMFQEALRQHRSVLAFHASAVRETKEAVAQTFQFGTYMKGLEIARFAELCNKSIQRALSKAEYPLLELTQRYFLWTEALTYLRNVAEPKKLPESHDFALSKGFSDAEELLQLTDNNDYAQLVTTDAIPANAYTPSIADGGLMKKVETQADCSLGIDLCLEDEAYSLGWDSANERAARRRQLMHRVQIAELSSRLLRCVLERHLGEATENIARMRLCLPTSNAIIHRSAAVVGEGEGQCEDMGSFPLKWSQRICEGSGGDDGGFGAAWEGGAFSRAVWEATLSSMELCVAAMRCNQSETGGGTAAATANVSASKMDGDVSSSDSSDSIRSSAMHCVELLLHVRDLLLVDSRTELHEDASSVFSPVGIRRASFFCFSLASWLPLVLQCVLATLPYSSIAGVGSEAQLDREILQLRALYPFSLLRSSVTAKSTTKSPDSGSGSDSAIEVDSALSCKRPLSAYIGMLDEVFASSETADAPSENLVGRTVLLLALVLLDILVGLRFSLATPSEIRKNEESASAAPDTARVGSTSSREKELGTACGNDESDNAESTAAVAVLNLYHRLADSPQPFSTSSSSSLASSASALTSAFTSHSSTIGAREDTGTAYPPPPPPPLSKGAVPAPAGYDEALQSVARQMVASHGISRDRLRQLLAQKIDSLLGNLNLRSSTLRAMES